MSIKRGFLNRSVAVAAVVGFAALVCAIPLRPAMADKWKHHHGYYYGPGPGYVVAPGFVYGGFYAPPPVAYYPPQPVYVEAPPPVVYAPPPVYYAPPSLNFGINIPLH